LWCWGNNAEGQLAQDDPFTGPGVNSAVPVQVTTPASWSYVSGGQGHTCAVTTASELYCWGRNSRGELGLGEAAAGQLRIPFRVGSAANWAEVYAGQNHTCGLSAAGEGYCWGENVFGQSFGDIPDPIYEPKLLTEISDVNELTVDTFHTCARFGGDEIQCFGRNVEGQLGDGTKLDAPFGSPASVPSDWTQISAGRFHTCGVRSSGLWCVGQNNEGRLGVGDALERLDFTQTRVVVP
jgi:alpha-tubulin suppressor-like RCC1 family protein